MARHACPDQDRDGDSAAVGTPAGVTEHVAIVGAGFAGTLLAINLLRHDGPRATLIERADVAGRGLAYGAAHPSHLLNVRAGNMSAFPDAPDHFVRWLERRGGGDAAAFVPRVTYGAYLREQLEVAAREAGGRLTVVAGEAIDCERVDGSARMMLANGGAVSADAAVLAVGNLPPHDPPGLDGSVLGSARYHGDPWRPGVADGLSDGDTVLLIGTGLTAIDVALMLEARGFAGCIVACSRRGLLPREHAPPASWRKLGERPASVASGLVRGVRARAGEIGWRQAVDELRPYTQAMWAQADPAQRTRFLRHLRPWWDVHRHRIAPAVAARLAAMRADGRLVVRAAKLCGAAKTPGGIDVTWRPRGADAVERLHVQRIVNCTGPQGDLQRTTDPLLRRLTARGSIRPDAARLGIDVDASARVIGADSTPQDWLYALGPMTRGAWWEIVAVPDIRAQSWAVARRLSNAHWVGGEGL